jgi:hypothetical protein
LVPALVSLDLCANTPQVAMPVHYVFGERDVTSAAVVKEPPTTVATPLSTVTVVPDAGHMVYFERPCDRLLQASQRDALVEQLGGPGRTNLADACPRTLNGIWARRRREFRGVRNTPRRLAE